MTEETDRLYERVLVLRSQTGDEAAFEELMGRYHRRLGYYLRRMLPQTVNAEDILQDVWFDVFRGIAKLSDCGAFAAWLYQIARNRAYRELRKRPSPGSMIDISQIESVQDPGEFSPEDAEQVHWALDQLSPEHREVLVLRFIEDMTYEAIAAVTRFQIGTVKSRIHYAKHELRRIMRTTEDDG